MFDFEISQASASFEKDNSDFDKRILKGFEHFHDCLESYFRLLEINSSEGSRIKIFGSVTLNNGAILRTTNKYHNRPWFSNIAVNMDSNELFDYLSDSGICYAQVYINKM